MTTTKGAQERAVRAETKEERARDAAQAMQEYQKEKLAVLARTERLRAERLAKEASDALEAKTQEPKTLEPKTLEPKTPGPKTPAKEKR